MGFCQVKPYGSKGLLVSFIMFTIHPIQNRFLHQIVCFHHVFQYLPIITDKDWSINKKTFTRRYGLSTSDGKIFIHFIMYA